MKNEHIAALKFIPQSIVTLAVPILFTLTFIRLLMFPAFLNFEYTRPGFPADTYGFTTEDRLQYGSHALEYLLSDATLSYFDDLRLPPEKCYPVSSNRDCALFNPRELGHLYDVKLVVQAVFAFGIIYALVTFISTGILWQLETPHRTLQRALFSGSLLTLSLLAMIVVLVFTAWDVFFDGFHALFFEDGTWQFYFSDTLIRLYPQQFWFDASVTIGMLVGLSALLIFGFTWRWQQRQFLA